MDRQVPPWLARDPALLEAIGRITINVALLEEAISLCIWALIGGEQQMGQIVTAQLSFRQLVDLSCSLYRFQVSDPAVLAELEGIRKSLHEAEGRRHRIIHSGWAAGPESGAGLRSKIVARAKQGLQYQFEKVTATDIDSLADFLATLADEIVQLMDKTPFGETEADF